MSTRKRSPMASDPERLGRYRILRKLGQGGMGAVYLAEDSRLRRRVALKILPPDSVADTDAVARFQREARALASLCCPGIVQVYDADEDRGLHFLVMEHLKGRSLAGELRARGRLPPALAADCARQAALALQHAHERPAGRSNCSTSAWPASSRTGWPTRPSRARASAWARPTTAPLSSSATPARPTPAPTSTPWAAPSTIS